MIITHIKQYSNQWHMQYNLTGILGKLDSSLFDFLDLHIWIVEGKVSRFTRLIIDKSVEIHLTWDQFHLIDIGIVNS
jgi:hypothetical protein